MAKRKNFYFFTHTKNLTFNQIFINNRKVTIGIFDKPEKIVSFLISDEQNQ